MNARSRYVLNCLAIGVLTVTMVALLGFWARWLCMDALGELMRDYSPDLHLSPLGLLPEEIENDPNVVVHSAALLYPNKRTIAPWRAGLGAVGYYDGLMPWRGRSDVFAWQAKPDGDWVHYDRKRGLVVFSRVEKITPRDGGRRRIERTWLYAGPEGMAETPSEALGRFQSPVATPYGFFLYDAQQRRFFKLDFKERKVVKGPEIDPNERHDPVQIHSIARRPKMFSWEFVNSPMRRKDPNEPEIPADRFGHALRQVYPNADLIPTVELVTWAPSHVLVLDASGRIDLLDPETLTLTHRAGALPDVGEAFDRHLRRAPGAEALFAYEVRPVSMPLDEERSQWEYLGCVAGAYNRDGTSLGLAVYDKQGTRIKFRTARTISYDEVAGAPLVTTIRYLLENLHPPALLWLSHFTAPYTKAGAGYRSLFIVPDSFVAKSGRELDQILAFRLIGAFTLMAPAIVLAVILAVSVARDTRVVGFSKDARTLWILITVAFGLPAYMTYRLTRPGVTLVTCANCGLRRRPDMDRCHRCNSPWDVPELRPPAWRVMDGGRRDFEEPLRPTEDVADE